MVFHLGRKPAVIEDARVVLDDGTRLDADLVVMGVGVRPRTDLAEQAGLNVDRGVVVDAFMESSAPGIFAAGDIARFPYALAGGGSVRIEHWVVAERQGQIAAMNMLGRREKYEQAPFFWSQHYEMPINYVGHAEAWDSTEVVGAIQERDGLVRFRKDGRTLAVASISRDRENLTAELELEGSRRESCFTSDLRLAGTAVLFCRSSNINGLRGREGWIPDRFGQPATRPTGDGDALCRN